MEMRFVAPYREGNPGRSGAPGERLGQALELGAASHVHQQIGLGELGLLEGHRNVAALQDLKSVADIESGVKAGGYDDYPDTVLSGAPNITKNDLRVFHAH